MTEAEEAAAAWGGKIQRPLRLRENEVYELDISGRRAALRLHRKGYQSVQSIRSELWWCAELGRMGLPVATPVSRPSGDLLVSLSTGRSASVVSWIDGQPLGEAGVPLAGEPETRLARHRELGVLLARVHKATDQMRLPEWFQRPRWDLEGLTGQSPLWGRFWEHPLLDPQQKVILTEARLWLSERLQTSRSPFGLIHADVLRENVFVNKDSLSLIDFDDSGYGYRWYDLGTVLSQDLYQPDHADLRLALVEGYSSLLPVDADEVDAFTLARTLASVGWAATRLPMDHPVHASHIARAVMMAQHMMHGHEIG